MYYISVSGLIYKFRDKEIMLFFVNKIVGFVIYNYII
jgi:hypothetical protein